MVFSQLALEGMPHVLIQKYAKDIALSIETAFPGIYEAHTCVGLRNVGISQLPKIEIKGYDANLKVLGIPEGNRKKTRTLFRL